MKKSIQRIIIPLVLLFLFLFSYSFPGTITGTISIPSKIKRPAPENSSHIVQSLVQSNFNEFDNVIVYIEKMDSDIPYTSYAIRPIVEMKQLAFIPHVTPILVGTTIEFLNNDDFSHHIFSFSTVKSFDLGEYSKGVRRPVTFNNIGIADVYCQNQSAMQAFVVVLQNPYFTKPDSSGGYRLNRVPAGRYTLVIWHDVLKSIKQEIDVPEDGTLRLDFKLSKLK